MVERNDVWQRLRRRHNLKTIISDQSIFECEFCTLRYSEKVKSDIVVKDAAILGKVLYCSRHWHGLSENFRDNIKTIEIS